MGALRCNVASPRHYFGRAEVSLGKANRVRTATLTAVTATESFVCLRKSHLSLLSGVFYSGLFWRGGLFQYIQLRVYIRSDLLGCTVKMY